MLKTSDPVAATEAADGEPVAPSSAPAASSPGALFANTPEYLLDVRLTVSAEIGRVQLPVRQVLQLGAGSLVELQRSASEPVDVLANGHCIARGEIVVIGEHFGIRITELGADMPGSR